MRRAKYIPSLLDFSRYGPKQEQRANWNNLVPEMTFVILLCDTIRERVGIEEIAGKAVVNYPNDFLTWVNGKEIPDLSLILLTLNEAKRREWGYVAGNWFNGWRLTKKGLKFAQDIELRRLGRGRKLKRCYTQREHNFSRRKTA